MILLSLNPSTDQFKKFINGLPYSVLLYFPIKSKDGEVIDFELKLFNPLAEKELPGLQSWYPGAALRDLFQEDVAIDLFLLYKKVLDSDTIHRSNCYSTNTKLRYSHTVQSFHGGILATKKLNRATEKRVPTSKDFDSRLAQYKASVYEHYRNYL